MRELTALTAPSLNPASLTGSSCIMIYETLSYLPPFLYLLHIPRIWSSPSTHTHTKQPKLTSLLYLCFVNMFLTQDLHMSPITGKMIHLAQAVSAPAAHKHNSTSTSHRQSGHASSSPHPTLMRPSQTMNPVFQNFKDCTFNFHDSHSSRSGQHSTHPRPLHIGNQQRPTIPHPHQPPPSQAPLTAPSHPATNIATPTPLPSKKRAYISPRASRPVNASRRSSGILLADIGLITRVRAERGLRRRRWSGCCVRAVGLGARSGGRVGVGVG